MRARHVALVVAAMAAAVTVTSIGAATPVAVKQRVAVTVTGVADGSLSGKFVLEPLQAGPLKRDSGLEQGVVVKERSVVRDGQSVKVVTWVTTAKGKQGTFVIRAQINHVDAGNGFGVGSGTWALMRGTGQYEGFRGGGRLGQADASGRSGPWSERREGVLILP